MDRVSVTGITVHGRHGVYEHERRAGQPFVVDLTLELDTSAAAAVDDLTLTVDYSAVARSVADVVAGEPVMLLETLAAQIADRCLQDGRVDAVEVTVHKPHAPLDVEVSDVSVSIRRQR